MAGLKIVTLRASFTLDLFYCIQFLLLLSITSKISKVGWNFSKFNSGQNKTQI